MKKDDNLDNGVVTAQGKGRGGGYSWQFRIGMCLQGSQTLTQAI